MKANLVTREPELLKYWEETDLYGQIQAARPTRPFSSCTTARPSPTATCTWAPRSTRSSRTSSSNPRPWPGSARPYVPGWDCHGLPIEFKVVKQDRGLSPVEVRRRSEELARKFIDIQRRQFKRLGVFGDWEHPYLTLDPGYEAEVLRAFGKLVERGLVYQSKKPVYWSTGARTALAEAEVEYHEEDAPAIYVKFPLVTGPLAGKASMVIWTTTPWTLPPTRPSPSTPASATARRFTATRTRAAGDARAGQRARGSFCRATGYARESATADGPRASSAANSKAGRTSTRSSTARGPVILGEFVTLDAGTGCVHIAPGHGNEDFVVGPQIRPARVLARGRRRPVHRGVRRARSRRPVRVRRQPARHRHAQRHRRARGRGHDPPHLPALLALQGADHLPRGGPILHPHGRTAPRGAPRHRRA